MSATSDAFSLDAKFTQAEGRVYLSGIQALVRLPLDQHRADARRGLRTATFISGYRGSPLGGLDQTLERNGKLLAGHDVVFASGAQRGPRRDGGVRQPDDAPVPGPQVRRCRRHVVRQGARRRPLR